MERITYYDWTPFTGNFLFFGGGGVFYSQPPSLSHCSWLEIKYTFKCCTEEQIINSRTANNLNRRGQFRARVLIQNLCIPFPMQTENQGTETISSDVEGPSQHYKFETAEGRGRVFKIHSSFREKRRILAKIFENIRWKSAIDAID